MSTAPYPLATIRQPRTGAASQGVPVEESPPNGSQATLWGMAMVSRGAGLIARVTSAHIGAAIAYSRLKDRSEIFLSKNPDHSIDGSLLRYHSSSFLISA